ncbi:MAG: hypothetical protein OXG44_06255 [Gammaproteobacteria bacterium]|nr:hypothetical protein [Gammaproteobacteria bacterium]
MALGILRGPAGAGKSQELQPGELRADLTALWAALYGYDRGPDGRFPERSAEEAAIASYLKGAVVRFAARQGLSGFATTSDSSPEAVERLREQGATGPVRSINTAAEVSVDRLSDADGNLSDSCRQALRRWFREPGVVERAEAAVRSRKGGRR